jgi:hypothetical protein
MVMAMAMETELSCRPVVGNEAHPCRVRNHVKPYTLHRVFPNTSAHAVEATEVEVVPSIIAVAESCDVSAAPDEYRSSRADLTHPNSVPYLCISRLKQALDLDWQLRCLH